MSNETINFEKEVESLRDKRAQQPALMIASAVNIFAAVAGQLSHEVNAFGTVDFDLLGQNISIDIMAGLNAVAGVGALLYTYIRHKELPNQITEAEEGLRKQTIGEIAACAGALEQHIENRFPQPR